ncbi:MAG: RNA polymerase sigma factor FliA, partial [Gammaproteobacteria bacterium]|nr:RNA polymerase sigma factor FliA [Gammaproteobacteria bacterium]
MREDAIAAYSGGDAKSDLVSRYAKLVKRIAHQLMARLPNNVQLDDLIQSGMIGLLEAASKFDGTRGASFETYASIRIRGAMLDEVRRGDWTPRSVHRNARRVAQAVREVEASTGCEAKVKEIADVMGVELDEYFRILKDASSIRLFSYEDLAENSDRADLSSGTLLSEHYENQEFRERLVQAIENLPEREKLVLSLYYDEELNLKEIGAV